MTARERVARAALDAHSPELLDEDGQVEGPAAWDDLNDTEWIEQGEYGGYWLPPKDHYLYIADAAIKAARLELTGEITL